MSPGTYALHLRRNAVQPMRLTLYCLDGGGTEVAMNIIGYSLKLQVRMYPGAPDPALLSVGTATGEITIVDAVNGIVEINWPAVIAAIRALPSTAEPGDPTQPRVDTFAYDLLLTASDGSAQVILEGPVPVSFGVTR